MFSNLKNEEDETKSVSAGTVSETSKKTKKRRGKVANITSDRVIIDVDGNGEWIAYDATKHATLKKGDPIEF